MAVESLVEESIDTKVLHTWVPHSRGVLCTYRGLGSLLYTTSSWSTLESRMAVEGSSVVRHCEVCMFVEM